MRGYIAVALVLVTAVLVNCTQGNTEPLSRAKLANASYQIEWGGDGVVQLSDGEYHNVEEGVRVTLTDLIAIGDLNGDGVDDAAALLVVSPGGSGVFRYAAVAINRDGEPDNVACLMIGDRVDVKVFRIENSEIVAEMIAHGPDDPMCCPTQSVVRRYRLEGDVLRMVDRKTRETHPE